MLGSLFVWKRTTVPVFGSKFLVYDHVVTYRGAQKEQTTLYALCAINGPCCVLYAFQQKVVMLINHKTVLAVVDQECGPDTVGERDS